MPDDQTDEQVLRSFVEGDDEALGALADRYEPALLGLARGVLGQDGAAAADAVQSTWLRVIRYAPTFRGRSSVKTWLYRIVLNECRRGAGTRSPSWQAAISNDQADSGEAPEQSTLLTERNGVLRDAVGKLSSRRRELLLLTYHEGMTNRQAAEILGIPLGTLKSRLHGALEALRRSLPPEVFT